MFRLKLLLVKLVTFTVMFKWRVLGFYYNGLAVQADYLYRQSPLFKERWRLFGLEFAEKEFLANGSEAMFFFHKAQREPLQIRAKIFWNGLTGVEHRPYYLSEN